MRFLTAGESHGKCLTIIIDDVPANFEVDIDFINNELAKRQQGYGRGGRMLIETDKVEVKSGIRFGKTLGSPICFEIKNKDFENWQEKMSSEKIDKEFEKITLPRPGHADLSGCIKYNQDDIRNILERSSARETASRVAVGALAQNFLQKFNIKGSAKVISVGGSADENIKEKVDIAKEKGTTLGGVFEIKFENLPVGLGSFVQWDRRLDGILAQAIMSIPAVKAVEIGEGIQSAYVFGSDFHDEIYFENNEYKRKTNNAGGIEGGMTNGEDLVIRGYMKPIPTMKTPLKSVDIKTKKESDAHFERSDVTAVEACSVVALNMTAIMLFTEFQKRYGFDNFEQIKANYER